MKDSLNAKTPSFKKTRASSLTMYLKPDPSRNIYGYAKVSIAYLMEQLLHLETPVQLNDLACVLMRPNGKVFKILVGDEALTSFKFFNQLKRISPNVISDIIKSYDTVE